MLLMMHCLLHSLLLLCWNLFLKRHEMERGQGRGPISRAAPRPGCGDNPEGKSKQGEDYPEVQWLRLCFHYRRYGFDPWGTKIPHAVLCIQKFLFKKERETRGNTKSEVPFLPSLLPLSWPHYNAPKLRVCVCVCVCVCWGGGQSIAEIFIYASQLWLQKQDPGLFNQVKAKHSVYQWPIINPN